MKTLQGAMKKNLKLLLLLLVKPKKAFFYIQEDSTHYSMILLFTFALILIMTPSLWKSYTGFKNLFKEFSPWIKFISFVVGNIILLALFLLLIFLFLLFKTLVVLIATKFLKEKIEFRTLLFVFSYCMMLPLMLGMGVLVIFPSWMEKNISLKLLSIILEAWDIVLSTLALSVFLNVSSKKSLFVILPWIIIVVILKLI